MAKTTIKVINPKTDWQSKPDYQEKLLKRRLTKPDMTSRTGKYFLAKRVCKSREQAMRVAGYHHGDNPARIESTKTYQAIEKLYYKDEVLKKMTLAEIANEQVKVIKQDINLAAKNQAIKNVMERVEPETNPNSGNTQVLIVLKG